MPDSLPNTTVAEQVKLQVFRAAIWDLSLYTPASSLRAVVVPRVRYANWILQGVPIGGRP